MKRFLFVFVFFFSLFVFQPISLHAQNTVSPTATIAEQSINRISNQASCGAIGAACCLPFDPPPYRLGEINVPLVSYVANPLISWLNSIFSIADNFVDATRGIVNTIRGEKACAEGKPSDENNLATCTCLPEKSFNIANLCTGIKNTKEKQECINCSSRGVWTAIGCVDFKMETFLRETVFGWGVGLSGIIALLCIIYSAIIMQTSQGNPEQIKKAQENLTSCILGLILIIFSVLILRIIGVDILRIPGFG